MAGLALCFLFFHKDNLSATTIRIVRFIGGVTLEDDGGETALREDMLLRNGNILSTADDGSVDLNLDDTKVAGLDVSSRAAFVQDGKAISIDVESGAIYFYTTEKLADDESMDIKTQTMMVGIRGTSGYVIYNPKNGVTRLTLTSGKVHITGTNPKTGGVNETDVYAGQSVQTYLYNYLKGKESIQFVVEDVEPEDVPPLLMQKIVSRDALFESVADETGWWKEDMQAVADSANVVNAAVAGSGAYATESAGEREAQNGALITAYDSNGAAASGDSYAKEVAGSRRGEAMVMDALGGTPDRANAIEDAAEASVAMGNNVPAQVQAAERDSGEGSPSDEDGNQESSANQGNSSAQNGSGNAKSSDSSRSSSSSSSGSSRSSSSSGSSSGSSSSSSSSGNAGTSGGSSSGGSSSGASGNGSGGGASSGPSGNSSGSGSSSGSNGNSSSGGSSSDTGNGGSGNATVAVTGVTLDKESASIKGLKKTLTLTATVAPSDAANQNISWSSSDMAVATVSDGVVTPVGSGSVTITVKTEDGSYTDTCEVEITELTATIDKSKWNANKSSLVVNATAFERAQGSSSVPNDAVEIQNEEISGCEIYLWNDSSDKTAYWYSEADTVYLPSDSSALFFTEVATSYTTPTKIDMSDLDTSQVTNMAEMFMGCIELEKLDVSKFDTSKVTNMSKMFAGCEKLTKLDVSEFDTSRVTDMSYMFLQCKLTELNVSNFNTSQVVDMEGMFSLCENLTKLDISKFDTSQLRSTAWMFNECKKIEVLDISGFNTAELRNMVRTFSDCSNLKTIYVSPDFALANLSSSASMFSRDISLVGGAGTTYDANHIDGSYAHIDGGESNPGYFTAKGASSRRRAFSMALPNALDTLDDEPAAITTEGEPTDDEEDDTDTEPSENTDGTPADNTGEPNAEADEAITIDEADAGAAGDITIDDATDEDSDGTDIDDEGGDADGTDITEEDEEDISEDTDDGDEEPITYDGEEDDGDEDTSDGEGDTDNG